MLRDLDTSGFSAGTKPVRTDASLLARYVETRDEQAFTELVQRHLPLVYRAALRQLPSDAHRAEEAAQQVFTLLARRARTLMDHPTLTGWLYTTTYYTVRSARRTERRRRLREQEMQAMAYLSSEREASAAEWARVRPVIDEAMQELGLRDREAILARFFDQCGYAEIGARFAITEDAARMRVERALQKLRARLARHGLTSTSSALALAFASETATAVPTGMAMTIARAALTSAATSGAGGSMIAAFMTTNKLVVALGFALALAITAAFYSAQQETRAGTNLATASAQHAAAQARLADLHLRADSAEQRRLGLEAELLESRVAAAATAVAVKPGAGKSDMQARAAADTATFAQTALPLLRNDPVLKDLRLRRHRWNVVEDYGSLFREFGFSRAQIDKFVGIFSDWAETRPERGERWSIDPYVDGIVPKEEFVAKVRAEFGDAVAERYADLQSTRRSRGMVNFLEAHLYYLDEPFTRGQAEQLGKLIESAVEPGNTDLKPEGVDWERVLAKAEQVLSARQMEGLRSLAAQGRVAALLKSAENKK